MVLYRRVGFAVAAALLCVPFYSSAQQLQTAPLFSATDGMLVTSNDVNTCPYTLVGPVSVNMRATSWRLKELEPEAIASKLRKSARKMGAHAVVLVTVGQSHATLMSLRSTPITGRAIRYADPSCAPTS